jgi:hypothetical protein
MGRGYHSGRGYDTAQDRRREQAALYQRPGGQGNQATGERSKRPYHKAGRQSVCLAVLLPQAPAGAEQQRLHRRVAHVELAGNFRVREAFDLP